MFSPYAARVDFNEQIIKNRQSGKNSLDRSAEKRRLLRAENALLKEIKAVASFDLLCLDMDIEEIKREIDIKMRVLEALKRNN